jgi:hypothetical protein
MPPTIYPTALVLDSQACLVIGGEIADGKLDARLSLITPIFAGNASCSAVRAHHPRGEHGGHLPSYADAYLSR